MTAQFVADRAGDPLVIRFDGLDAALHHVEISDLALSLKGFSRILTVAGTFAANQRLIEKSKARPVRVLIGPPEANCVTLKVIMTWLDQHAFASEIASGFLLILVGYVFSWATGQREEMRHLKEALETAIRQLGHRDDAIVGRLLDTVDRMADVLKPAARQAAHPVGRSAGTLTINGEGAPGPGVVIGQAERDAMDQALPPEIGDERMIVVRFSEMNLDSRTCRISLADAPESRFAADISDPEIMLPDNAYARAFAAQSALTVRAKPTTRDGHIERWYISGHS